MNALLVVHYIRSAAFLLLFAGGGLGHLAGIIGTPTISLFGPTDPARWKPLGPKVHIVRGESLESVSVEEVFSKA